MSLLFAADIGGTNCRFAIVSLKGRYPRIMMRADHKTKKIDLYKKVDAFLGKAAAKGYHATRGGFSVAGPIQDGPHGRRASLTNAKLVVDEALLAARTELDAAIVMNDYEALPHATNALAPKSKKVLRRGKPAKGQRALVGPGTGLGVGIGVYDAQRQWYLPVRSEGCHSDFPLQTVEEFALAAFIREEMDWHADVRITNEDILSGRGLERIYRYLRIKRFLGKQHLPMSLSAAEIAASKTKNPCSKATFKEFERFLGRRCKNIVLDAFATGGLYLAGGVVMKNPEQFGKAFLAELGQHHVPAFKKLLESVPVTVITDEDVGLYGAALGASTGSRP